MKNLQIEQLEERIAPSGLSACLSTVSTQAQAHLVDVNVGDAAVAATGHGVVTVVEGPCIVG